MGVLDWNLLDWKMNSLYFCLFNVSCYYIHIFIFCLFVVGVGGVTVSGLSPYRISMGGGPITITGSGMGSSCWSSLPRLNPISYVHGELDLFCPGRGTSGGGGGGAQTKLDYVYSEGFYIICHSSKFRWLENRSSTSQSILRCFARAINVG